MSILIVISFCGIFAQSSKGKPCKATPTVKDYDGNVYNTVQIGRQCWLRENLRTTHYADGTSIAFGNDKMSTTTPYRYYPNADEKNVPVYGYLYNWAAVMHDSQSSNLNPSGVQGVCPKGWHVPSYAEWKLLVATAEKNEPKKWYGIKTNNSALKLCGDIGWSSKYKFKGDKKSKDHQRNYTGFSAIPSGAFLGYYYTFQFDAPYWSSTLYEKRNEICYFYLKESDYYYIDYNGTIDKPAALAVRCIHN